MLVPLQSPAKSLFHLEETSNSVSLKDLGKKIKSSWNCLMPRRNQVEKRIKMEDFVLLHATYFESSIYHMRFLINNYCEIYFYSHTI